MNKAICYTLFASALLMVSAALAGAEDTSIDEFMQQVFENRDAGYRLLEKYNFFETENLRVYQAAGDRLLNSRLSEYEWFTRGGRLIRSPVRRDGVIVPAGARQAYQQEWLTGGRAGKRRSALREDSFFHFTYEPGRYFLAGREERQGRTVVLIDYLPDRHFQENGRDPIGSRGDEYDAGFDKTSLVRFVVDLEERQIVAISFSNADLDYLPYGWVVKFENLDATISYMKLPGGAWVPEELELKTSFDDADSSKNIVITRKFMKYAKTKVNIEFEVVEPDTEEK